jgi:putative transposase
MKKIMRQIENDSDFKIEEMEIDKDHIHFMIKSTTTLSPSQNVRKLKQESTISIWRLFPKELLKEFWKEHTFWTDGYFVSSIGEVSSQSLKRYFQNQG